MEEYEGYVITVFTGIMYHIGVKGRGSVPKELRGLYTSPAEARKAIDRVVANKRGKGNGKAKSTD